MKLLWSVTLPIKTVSEGNRGGEHWSKKSRRHRIQKEHVKAAYHRDRPSFSTQSIMICICRIAPRKLDSTENLGMALKWITDACAELIYPGLAIGRADGKEGLRIEVNQQKGKPKEYAVKIEIYEEMQV